MPVLDQKFWSRFAKTVWEKKSVAVRDIQSPLLQMDENVIFDLLVDYSARCRRLKSADGMKFYIDGHKQFESEVLRHLPKKSDRNFAGYHERMSSQYADYCLVCDELLQMNNEQQENFEEFTSMLFSNVGLPNRFSEIGLYLGNYRKTPFGVHEDGCGVFSFPVVGKKKFRIWTPEYVKQNPSLVRAFTYAKHKAASQVLEARVGDMTYWPAPAWHIAESDGSFSVTWSLGVWVDRPLREVVSEVTNDLFKNALGKVGNSRTTKISARDSAEVTSLPQDYLEALKDLEALSSEKIQSALRESWMKHLSMRGLKTHPVSDVAIRSGSRVSLRTTKRPILWMKDGTDTVYAFSGVSLRSSSKVLFKMVSDLNEGKTVKASTELKALQDFARAGAFA